MGHYTIYLTEKRYRTINVISTILILLPGFAAVILSISCIMQRTWFEMPDFTIDISFFLYRVVVAMALIWAIFEAFFRQFYGFEKFNLRTVIGDIAMIIATGFVIYWAGHGTAGWADLRQVQTFTPVILTPLVLIAVVFLAMTVLAVVLLTMLVRDLHSWYRYDHAEACEGYDSQSFIIFCRDNS